MFETGVPLILGHGVDTTNMCNSIHSKKVSKMVLIQHTVP